MRFAILHCRNPECSVRVWVPESKLGTRGRCPQCHWEMDTPGFVPDEDFTKGPQIMEDLESAAPAKT